MKHGVCGVSALFIWAWSGNKQADRQTSER